MPREPRGHLHVNRHHFPVTTTMEEHDMKPILATSAALCFTLFSLSAMTQAEMSDEKGMMHESEMSEDKGMMHEPGMPPAEEIKQDTKDLLASLKAYGADQREAAVKATKEALEAADERIDALQARLDENWDDMSEAAREKTQASMTALRERRAQVAEWYEDMESSSDSAWDEIKEGFAEAYEALGEAWHEAVESFEEE